MSRTSSGYQFHLNRRELSHGSVWTECPVEIFGRSKTRSAPCECSLNQLGRCFWLLLHIISTYQITSSFNLTEEKLKAPQSYLMVCLWLPSSGENFKNLKNFPSSNMLLRTVTLTLKALAETLKINESWAWQKKEISGQGVFKGQINWRPNSWKYRGMMAKLMFKIQSVPEWVINSNWALKVWAKM